MSGELVTVHWPGGPYDFVLQDAEVKPAPADGWFFVQGLVVQPEGPEHRAWRTFYVQPVEDGYALLPNVG